MMRKYNIEEERILQQFLDEGYKIEYEGEKELKVMGIYHPLVQHHYDDVLEEEATNKYHIIGDGDDEELLTYSFDTPDEVLDFIINHYQSERKRGGKINV